MRTLHGTMILAATGVWLTLGAAGAAAQTAPRDSPLTGTWQINRELSAQIPDAPAAAQQPPGGRTGGGQGGRVGGGGGGGGGRIGGGRGGAGRGGGGGMGAGTGRAGGMTEDDQAKLRVLLRENRPPDRLALLVLDGQLTMTDDSGVERVFPIDDKKTAVEFEPVTIDTKTKWDKGAIVQELSGGPLTLTRTYQVTSDGNQLVITIRNEGGAGRGGQRTPFKFVYDRERGAAAGPFGD